MYNSAFKRILDLIFSVVGLIVFSPILVMITIILLIVNNGQPFFFQKRIGKNDREFSIVKFKTMNEKKDKQGKLLSDEKRLTSLGRIMRKLSLDELPQFLNVISGEMSIVGPRPLLPEYLPLYNKIQKRRHEVKPGITGWAQVNGRNAITWEKKFEYDIWYVNNISFNLDCRILLLTLKKVIKKEGISSDNSVSMEKFKGN